MSKRLVLTGLLCATLLISAINVTSAKQKKSSRQVTKQKSKDSSSEKPGFLARIRRFFDWLSEKTPPEVKKGKKPKKSTKKPSAEELTPNDTVNAPAVEEPTLPAAEATTTSE